MNGFSHNDAFAEASLYHDASRRGFVAIRQSNFGLHGRQICCPVSQLRETLSRLAVTGDYHISQNEFAGPNRRKANLARICLVYVDLDPHLMLPSDPNAYKRNLEPEDMTADLLDTCDTTGIPRPSLIVFSGRGLHVKWILENPIPRKALPRWSAVQSALCERLKIFGSDHNAIDASRTLRMAGSINPKSGQSARVVWINENPDGSVYKWPFERLALEVLPLNREQLNAKRWYARKGEPRVNRVTSGLTRFDPADLWRARVDDLLSLAQVRYAGTGVPEGKRNMFMFVVACGLAWIGDLANIEDVLYGIGHDLCPSLSTREIKSMTGHVLHNARKAARGEKVEYGGRVYDPRYRWTNQRLIELFEITDDEQQNLSTIISENEAQRRDRIRHRKESDRETYRSKARERKTLAQQLLRKGMSYARIAETVGVSKRMVINYVKPSANPGSISDLGGE